MGNVNKVLCAAMMFVVSSNVTWADPKPKGAKNADPQVIANFHAGKTQNWKSCKGGIYFGPNWEAQAWCERDGKAIGIGTWSVDRKGKICADLTWYWKTAEGFGSKKDVVDKEDCHEHVVDEAGTVWRSWGGEEEWWRLAGTKSFVKGFKYKSKVNRLRKQLGI